MGLSYQTRLAIGLFIIGISLFTWALLLTNTGHTMTTEHSHGMASVPSAGSLEMSLKMNPFSSQLMGWGLMVVAMMLPKLIMPIQFIHMRSLKRFRVLFSALFVLGYLAIWMVAGVFMTAAIIALNLRLPMSYIPALGMLVIAIIWQFSPIKQRFLNLGHEHRNLAAFGWPGARDVLHFGIMHGLWCVGSGWALMLFPMLLPQGHNVAMIIVTLIMISEHMERPRNPNWDIKLRLRLFKIIIARAKIKLM
jgi:predicted metal-binding membrane protein